MCAASATCVCVCEFTHIVPDMGHTSYIVTEDGSPERGCMHM